MSEQMPCVESPGDELRKQFEAHWTAIAEQAASGWDRTADLLTAQQADPSRIRNAVSMAAWWRSEAGRHFLYNCRSRIAA